MKAGRTISPGITWRATGSPYLKDGVAHQDIHVSVKWYAYVLLLRHFRMPWYYWPIAIARAIWMGVKDD